MTRFVANIICLLLVLICVGVRSSSSEGYEALGDPECQPLWLLVELPVAHKKVNYKLSTTHALVRRCMGINDEHNACVSIDKVVKIEKGHVVNASRGSNKKEYINVSWIYHEECKYQPRKDGCPIVEARKCHAKSTTHYYDEVNCICTCIVNIDDEDIKIDGEDACPAKSMMEFYLVSDPIYNSPNSQKEKVTKNHGDDKSMVKNGNLPLHKWPLLDPIANLIIEAGTSFIILRWRDPVTRKSGVTIESFRINWMSKTEKIKTREIEASKMENPERKICIQDVHPDTEYAVAIFIKVKSEDFFSRPTIRKVKTLSSNADSMIFHLGDIGGNEL